MDSQPKILAFAGSARVDSLNQKILRIAVEAATEAGAEVTWIDLRHYPMPLYDGDLEMRDGIPEKAAAMRALMNEHQGFLIASPEYNGSITPLLKNALDWVSRPVPDRSNVTAYSDKIVGLMGASPGFLGGIRSVMHLRWVMSKLGAIVLPDQVNVGKAHQYFDSDDNFTNAAFQRELEALGRKVVEMVTKLHR